MKILVRNIEIQTILLVNHCVNDIVLFIPFIILNTQNKCVELPLFRQFSCSVMSYSATPQTTACQASLSITNHQSLFKLISIELVISSNHFILCHPLLLTPSVFPSIRIFSNESALCIRWPMYWSFSFSISPSNEYSGLISFRMGWFDLVAVQGTLKSLLNSTVQKHLFFGAQLSLQSNSHIHT